MEGHSRMDEVCPQLLDLIPKEREWLVKKEVSLDRRNHGVSEEKKLELRLGPPGVEDWTLQENKPKGKEQESLLSLGHFPNMNQNCWMNGSHSKANGSYLQFQSTTQQSSTVVGKESSRPCCTNPADAADKKAFSPASVNTAVANTSQKRTAPAPVVGWPPIRSFRKNLANSSSAKQTPELTQRVVPNKAPVEKNVETSRKGLFVKINMDGVPIGRKVDLRAYDSYEKLSSAVDELFRGLLAAQKDSSASGSMNSRQGEKAITGLLDGTGEYTLVYEDNEGDRMLAGDVPWHMFVSTVKRLRVLKSSELSKLCLGSKQEKIELNG